MRTGDSAAFREKKAFFQQVITVYGRKPVLEALLDESLQCYRLHLADSNKPAPELEQMETLARRRGVEICLHNKRELSRISRNGKQDQGVAADILCPEFQTLAQYLEQPATPATRRLLALDGISNPQNVGMLVRSAVAGGIDGILWPASGNAELGPLAIKASAGTLYRAPLVRCEDLAAALRLCQQAGHKVCILDAAAKDSLYNLRSTADTIYVLGNESTGVSRQISALADSSVSIPMQNGVESLNVAVTAALIAYLDR
ncbi:MAG: RNA methyltransferase [Gammaproteobacteria bacterium]|nr:RNA methyltransferase [Gammaproteobacteria bacterium]